MFNYNFTMKSTVVQFISTTSLPLPPITNRMAERSTLGGKREVDSSSRFALPFSPSHVDSEKKNKLAKARKMRKPPGMLGLKKFGPGKI